MGLKIKTPVLQEMVAKAVKGAGNNKMIPLTSLMCIKLEGGELSITTTDATNYLTLLHHKVTGDDFYVVLQADLFNKLVSKTSSEFVELTLNENSLQFKGNGKYTIDLPLDEEGNLIRFPEYVFNHDAEKTGTKLSTFKLILAVNKAALADTMEAPCYTGYYFGDKAIITSDLYNICYTATKVFDVVRLYPSELISLLGVMTEENLTIQHDENKVLFTTDNCTIYGQAMDSIDDFAVNEITGLVEQEFPSMCKLPRQELISVLDRLSLFITQHDRNGVDLLFTQEGLVISSKRSTGSELVKFAESKGFMPFKCLADVESLRSNIAAQNGESIELWYGLEQALKFKNGIVTQIVALLDDEVVGMDEGIPTEDVDAAD